MPRKGANLGVASLSKLDIVAIRSRKVDELDQTTGPAWTSVEANDSSVGCSGWSLHSFSTEAGGLMMMLLL